ncbi:DegT/DnrJ/EryC1/StrS family aminotransferase [Leptolyngbya sp. 7M]|uniref:DegT/DnrJ/EryC1/StrS family aminotransferase n=1 Tax=Leptolyngbya sp. 7M TaxID=2812896 RepID=UPI001B8B0C98|nr:DegT/DnrJ/EryC1/StrS family aminotransferase [Leptolyngbya sp. 7M]QYO62206.1 DegT/DnrJ/EryC1/StrS family aminotransferase [Leptolyngbya sp. 7M]
MNIPLLDLKQQNESLRPEIEAALGRVLDTNSFILGGEVAELERELADYCGVKHAIGCASGSDALLLAMMVFDIGSGDEVITTPYSFFATVSAITRLGATPVFVDIDPETYNIDVDQIEAKITDRTKAIQPVHLYGQCADMAALNAITEKYGIPVIEDAAQAIGAEENGRRAGAMSAVGCFSFYPSKNLGGMGDGGFMTTNDDDIADKLRALRVHGSRERYYHKWVGLNSRLDGFQGAVLRVKLPHLDSWSDKRKANADLYRELFAKTALSEQIVLPSERTGCRHIYNQFVVRIPEVRDSVRAFLTERGVGTDIYYPVPLHLQECFLYLGYAPGDLPESEIAAAETLALPIYPELCHEEIEYVVTSISEYFEQTVLESASPKG